jgi:hypothetical protein
MEWVFDGHVVEWRGPAPFYFAAMPVDISADVKDAARGLVYWGQVPVVVTIGATEFETALFPKDGRYLVPLKAAVRRAELIDEGDIITVTIAIPGVC